VRSVELLSQTISSDSKPTRTNTARAVLIAFRDSVSKRSSLNAGMTMEIFNGSDAAVGQRRADGVDDLCQFRMRRFKLFHGLP